MGRTQEASSNADAEQRNQRATARASSKGDAAPAAGDAEEHADEEHATQDEAWQTQQQQKGAAAQPESQDVSRDEQDEEARFAQTTRRGAEGNDDGSDLAAMDRDGAAAYQRYNPGQQAPAAAGTRKGGGAANNNTKKAANAPKATTHNPAPPLTGLDLNLRALPGVPAAAGKGAGGARGAGILAAGGVRKGPTAARQGGGLLGTEGTPTLEGLRKFAQQTISRVSKELDASYRTEMTDIFSEEARRLHDNAKKHHEYVSESLVNAAAAVKQAQEQHMKAKETVRKARDEAAAKAEDGREMRATLQGIKTKAEDQITRLRKKHKLA